MAAAPLTVRGQAAVGVAATAGSTVLGFLATATIAHLAGADALGGYLVAMAGLNVLLLAGDPGLGAAAFQRIAADDEPDRHFSALVAARLGLVPLLLAALWCAPGLDAALLPWLAAAVVVSTLASLAATGVLASARAGAAYGADLVGTAVRVAAQVAATAAGLGVAGLVAGFAAGSVAAGLADRRYLPLRLVRFERRHLAGLLPYAAWAFLAGLVAVAAANGDTLIVGALLDQRAVALYRVPVQLAALAALAGLPVRAAVTPHLVRAWAGGDLAGAGALLGRAEALALACALPVAVGGALLADRLLYTLYGPAFAAAPGLLVGALAAAVIGLLPLLDGAALAALNRPRRQFAAAAAGAVALLGLDLALIPAYGISGAAASLVAAALVAAVAARWARARLLPAPLDRRLLAAAALAAGAMAVALLALESAAPDGPAPLAGLVIAGAATYAGALLALEPGLRREARGACRALTAL